MLKPVHWLGSSRAVMRGLPPDARLQAGYELYRVQLGREPRHWKPMKSVGPGAAEIRVDGDRAYRVFYVAAYSEAVYVLHVFEKKSRKTSGMNLETGRARYREMIRLRREGGP